MALERLYFIRFLYKGDTIKEACERVNITEPTGYSWLDSWNNQGYAGLVPNFSGGPKPKLGDAEREELKRILGDKDAWTLREVRVLTKERFGVEPLNDFVGILYDEIERCCRNVAFKYGKLEQHSPICSSGTSGRLPNYA